MSSDLQDIFDLVLERLAAVGIDVTAKAEDDYRGDCPACGGKYKLTLKADPVNSDRVLLKCWIATCEDQHVLDSLNLTWADLHLGDAAEEDELSDELRSPVLADARPVTWAWQDRIPKGRPSLSVGNEGSGKGLSQ